MEKLIQEVARFNQYYMNMDDMTFAVNMRMLRVMASDLGLSIIYPESEETCIAIADLNFVPISY